MKHPCQQLKQVIQVFLIFYKTKNVSKQKDVEKNKVQRNKKNPSAKECTNPFAFLSSTMKSLEDVESIKAKP